MTDALFDPSTPVGLVRLLIPDMVEVKNTYADGDVTFILDDVSLQALLLLNGGNPRLAAADACEIIGTDELLIGKVIITDDLATDASKVAQQMFARAKSLRERGTLDADYDGGQDDFSVTVIVPSHIGSWTGGWPELIDSVPFPYSGH